MRLIRFVTVALFLTLMIADHSMAMWCLEPGESYTFVEQINDSEGTTDATSVAIRIYVNGTDTPVNYSGSGGTNGVGSMSLMDDSNTVGLYKYSFSVGTAPTQGIHSARICPTVGSITICDLQAIYVVDAVGECASRTGVLLAQPQQVRDAMKLAPTPGTPAADSLDLHLDDILEDTTEIGAAGAGLTQVAVAENGIGTTAISDGAIDIPHLSDFLKHQLGWVTDIDFTGNSGTFCLTSSVEAISVDNQYQDMTLLCGNEARKIEASVSLTNDKICTEAGRPYPTPPVGTCSVMVK